MALLLFFAFLAGFVTILAPCIWPLLPIVLSASSRAGKKRPLGITLGVMTSFTVFTLSISYLEKIFHLDPNLFRLLAVIIISILGVAMLIPSLGARFEVLISRILSPLAQKTRTDGIGFAAGYATGFCIGLVWAPCAGPILATVATLAATQSVDVRVVLVALAYVTGLGIPLFFLSLAGAFFFTRMRRVNKYTGRVQQVFGLVMIAAAILIYTNYDKTLQVKILNIFPSYGNFFNSIESNPQVTKQLMALRGEDETVVTVNDSSSTLPDLGAAPEILSEPWLNTDDNLSISKLKGKVVLVDFWTYSCINCIRTLPHLNGWHEKYKDRGLVIIGVHTPEFAFEKDIQNVKKALKQFEIKYPVVLDNAYLTWKNYKNHYWPAEYLIDANGRIRRTHFGEGEYDEMEMAIRTLLKESGREIADNLSAKQDETPEYKHTSETYIGAGRMKNFSSPEGKKTGVNIFTKPTDLPLDTFALEGTWNIDYERARAVETSALEIKFRAEKVFLVMSPGQNESSVKVFIDGNLIGLDQAGQDVKDGIIHLDTERLYEIIDLKNKVEVHTLRLEFSTGVSVYAFTFG